MAITKHIDEQIERLESMQKSNRYTNNDDATLAVAIEQALALAYIAREIARK